MATKTAVKGLIRGRVLIDDIPSMTPRERKEVANWLRRIGDSLRVSGKGFTSGEFCSRFINK